MRLSFPLDFSDSYVVLNFSDLPPASSVTPYTQRYWVTYVGAGGGSEWYSDGTTWHPVNNNVLLYRNNIPYGIACSGTIATDGTATLGTALGTAYSLVWLYFPAAAFATLPAGFYPVVMSSTTVGVVYTDSTLATPVTGSNVAYTGVTGAVVTNPYTLLGGVMGNNGKLWFTACGSNSNSVNNKIYSIVFGGSNIFSAAVTTTQGIGLEKFIRNRNSAALQIASAQGSYEASASASSSPQFTVDTTVDQTVSFNLNNAVATDWVIVESFDIVLIR